MRGELRERGCQAIIGRPPSVAPVPTTTGRASARILHCRDSMPMRRLLATLPFVALVLPAFAADDPPPVPREFRGVWVATVSNVDWPSKKGLPAAEQQAELR